jgi:hypothetical protein
MSALEELDRLRADVDAARAAVELARQVARRAEADLAAAKAPLLAYWDEVGAGEREPDPDLEGRLRAEVDRAGTLVETRFVAGAEGRSRTDLVDVRGEAIVGGAQRRLEQAEARLRAFAASSFGELADERAAHSLAVAARTAEAVERARAAEAEWLATRCRRRPPRGCSTRRRRPRAAVVPPRKRTGLACALSVAGACPGAAERDMIAPNANRPRAVGAAGATAPGGTPDAARS